LLALVVVASIQCGSRASPKGSSAGKGAAGAGTARSPKAGTAKVAGPAPSGKTFLQTNDKGFDEYIWLEDSSVVVRIPAGTFTMGSPAEEGDPDERPQHQVYLSEFYMDRTEVTNRQYKQFCNATRQSHPDNPGFGDMPEYFLLEPDCPVVNVSWDDALAYATWVGKRLPTEAEWEKAARGTDGRTYPWGNEEPEASGLFRANFCYWSEGSDGYKFTSPVGIFLHGASPYGCMDMAGNVTEWCNDWHDENYYGQQGNDRNPTGPSSGSYRVARGGSWGSLHWRLRSPCRFRFVPAHRDEDIGFRCCVAE
jgi:formylglycine-generating enzyme required for sulfatase activity